MQTQIFPCLGYQIVYDIRKDGRKIELFIDGIDRPDGRCLAALAPAEKAWDLFLLNGIYNGSIKRTVKSIAFKLWCPIPPQI